MARANGEEDKEVVFHTFQRLGVALQKGNATILACRMETIHELVDGVQ